MKTKKLNSLPGKPGLSGIAKSVKQLAVVAIVLVFSYTTAVAQTGGRIMFNTPFELNKVANGMVIVKIKLEGADIKNYTPETVAININNRTETVPIKTMVIQGDYIVLTIDLSGTSLMLGTGVGGSNLPNQPEGTSKLELTGNLKEITIDNVSGVIPNDDSYNAIILADATVIGVNDPNASNGVRPFNNTGNSDTNYNSSRGDNNIITKDEVQGFVNAYPNPAHDNMKIRTTNPKLIITEVVLINAIGSRLAVLHPDDDGHVVNIETGLYPAGVYFLQVKTNSGDAVKRIVIVN